VIFLNLIYLAALFKLVKHCFGAQIAMLSLFGVVTLPVFFQYSTLVWTVNAGVISILLALYCFLCATENGLNWKWAWAGMAAVAVGTLLSWEPILLGFALFGIALLLKSRDGIRAALAYVASGVLTLALILVGYATASPELRGDLWATISVRLGGNYQPQSVPIHALFDRMWYVGQPWDRWSLFGRALLLIGPVGLLATVGVLLWAWDRRNERKSPCFALGGLIGVWLGWFVVFPNHVYIHDYQWLLGAPLAGIAIGICLNAAGERFHGALCWLPLAAIPALLLVPLATEALHLNDLRGLHSGIVEYGLAIKENTPNTAVILSNSPSMVPVYYSDRHTLRYVDNEETLRIINREIWNIFPGSDVYLAITPDYAPRFPCALANFPTMGRTPNLLLLKMSADSCR
jgi:4-amino-4-deoxy-L-arabinose transferase-like glycosyltransferase